MKVRTAIFQTYVVASSIGFLILMRFVLAEVRPRYVSSIEGTMGESVRIIAGTLATQDPVDWQQTIESLNSTTTGLSLRVFDGDDSVVVAHAGAPTPETYTPKRFISSKERLSRFIDNEPFTNGDQLTVSAEITKEGTRLGRVELSRPLRTINSFIWSERRKLAIGALVIAAVMVILGWWLAHKLTSSLAKLANYARAVRDGEQVTPPHSRAVEINALRDAIEGMRRTLEGRDFVNHYTQNLTHELKSPISAIRGAAELLDEPEMPAKDRERFLANIRAEADRLQQIVERVMTLASLESQSASATMTDVSIRDVLTEIRVALQVDMEAKSVRLIEDINASAELVRGDRFLVYHALLNLVLNALEFSPEHGLIEISARGEIGVVRIEVGDGGPGFPAFAIDKAFDRFFSLPRPETGRKSTGLGLSFTREIARLHGGEVGVRNRPEGGAVAWINLAGS